MGTSHDSMQLAQMVMSDCGVSCAATDRLQTRVAERIQRHIDGLQPEPVGVPDSFREGVEAAARLIDQKADVYAARFGHDDMGGLSFGTGQHADIKRDTHSVLIKLADEIRALHAAPQPEQPAQTGGVHLNQAQLDALREVLRISDREHEAWRVVKDAIEGKQP